MADIRNCRVCHRMFTDYLGRRICNECMKADDELFDKVRDYLRENPGATIFSTAEACQVSESRIRQWVKEERLEYRQQEGSGLYCEKCGEPIATGRFCQKCKLALSRELGAILRENEAPSNVRVEKKKADTGSKMRFLNTGR